MALPISKVLEGLLQNPIKSIQLILEIDGLPAFSTIDNNKYANYGDEGAIYGASGFVYGGLIADPSTFPYIDIKKSTNNLTQQLLIDKGGFSSATNFNICLIDKDEMITRLVTPGNTIEDILGRKARIYFSLDGAGHPQDSVLFFSGIISDIDSGAGNVTINIASPEKVKNLEIYPKVSTELTTSVDAVTTTLLVQSANDFILPADSGTLRSYVRIDDELIEFSGMTSTSLTGCVRGALGTQAAAHDDTANVESFYRLTGNLRDLALKLMLSGGEEYFVSDLVVVAFKKYGLYDIDNAVFLADYNLEQKYGLVIGDTVNITGDAISGNNGTATVTDIVSVPTGSYILLDKTFVQSGAGALIAFKSKYNVLPRFAGLEMTPDQVDVSEYERVYTQFSTQFFSYDFYLKDTVNGSDFINTQILYPSGAYAIPRKAKTSIGLTIPPLAQSGTKKLTDLNIVGASTLKIKRSISKNFYNAVTYKYDVAALDDKYQRGKIRQSSDSTNRIKLANKPLSIVSDGIRQEDGFDFLFNTQARRFLDRYQYGAESLEVKVLFGEGFPIEIGDTVILEGSNLKISDTKDGNASRNFLPRLFEVQNKSLSLTGKEVTLSLVDTAYSLNGRYGVFAPSSIIDSGSTTTLLKLKQSYGDLITDRNPQAKWVNYVGETVLIRTEDWSYQETTKLVSLDSTNVNNVILDPPLSAPPAAGLIMDTPRYPTNNNIEDQALYKAVHCFWNKQSTVLSGSTTTEIVFDVAEAEAFKVGFPISIHDEEYNFNEERVIQEVVLSSISPSYVVLDTALSFTPSPGYKIELLGFADNGKAYRWL